MGKYNLNLNLNSAPLIPLQCWHRRGKNKHCPWFFQCYLRAQVSSAAFTDLLTPILLFENCRWNTVPPSTTWLEELIQPWIFFFRLFRGESFIANSNTDMDNICQSNVTNDSCQTEFRNFIFSQYLCGDHNFPFLLMLLNKTSTFPPYCGFLIMVRHCVPPQKCMFPHQWTRPEVRHNPLFTACLCLSSAHSWSVPFPPPGWGLK